MTLDSRRFPGLQAGGVHGPLISMIKQHVACLLHLVLLLTDSYFYLLKAWGLKRGSNWSSPSTRANCNSLSRLWIGYHGSSVWTTANYFMDRGGLVLNTRRGFLGLPLQQEVWAGWIPSEEAVGGLA